MPQHRKPSRARQDLTMRLVLPLVALVITIGTSAVAVASGLRANGTPFLAVMLTDGIVLVTSPVMAGMLLLLAAGGRARWRKAITGVALLAAAMGLAVAGIAWFGLGFRNYVGARASAQELKAAAADLLEGQRQGTRVTLSLRELPAGSALEPVRRLRPRQVRIDKGAGANDSEVYFGWGSERYGWGIRVSSRKVEYRYWE